MGNFSSTIFNIKLLSLLKKNNFIIYLHSLVFTTKLYKNIEKKIWDNKIKMSQINFKNLISFKNNSTNKFVYAIILNKFLIKILFFQKFQFIKNISKNFYLTLKIFNKLYQNFIILLLFSHNYFINKKLIYKFFYIYFKKNITNSK